ncbi:hypothetical protein [uncultured Psychromonas sp.]|uniref:hypothetical protein n=1 Tax=uncultured Psychromonas sp. TaxID=173974 RepID=UPI00262D4C7E|nr:hypothetical protein [uncultured Psychromonas sp.]
MKVLIFVFLMAVLGFNAHASTLLEGLSEALSETPYSAVVTPIKYSKIVKAENHESIVTIQAQVNTPIRGELPELITFIAVMDIEESLGKVGQPILIAFCQSGNDLYFAGVGAAFDVTEQIIHHAKIVTKGLSKTQSRFEFCH